MAEDSDDISSIDEDDHTLQSDNLDPSSKNLDSSSKNLNSQSENLDPSSENLLTDVSRGIDELGLTGACTADHDDVPELECDIRYWSTAVCLIIAVLL